MKEILITSSVLILALLLLRRLSRNTIPRRVQYALWGLVLLRLLIPAGLLPKSNISVLTTVDPVVRRMESQSIYIGPVRETVTAPVQTTPNFAAPADPQPVAVEPAAQDNTVAFPEQDSVTRAANYSRQIDLAVLLRIVWGTGVALAACWFLFTNLRFWLRLRRRRTPFPVENCKRPVWLVGEGLSSPCLFGLFRPAIYLTPAAVASPDTLRHVLAHEETHARHLDPLWSLLRGVCLAVYWFDPLVWWAALASRNDCELACDEGVLRRLGEGERIAYGRTLLSLIPVRKTPADPLLSATTMASGKRQLKERITRIAEHPRTAVAALLAVVAVAAAVCAVTFTAASGKPKVETQPLTAEELEVFSAIFSSKEVDYYYYHPYPNLFLVPEYKKPEDFDVSLLIRGAASLRAGVSEEEYAALAARGYEGERFKVSRLNLNQALCDYLGQGLSSEHCHQDPDYLEEYDAWFPILQEPCAPTDITFYSGERGGDKKGCFVRLYYRDEPDPSGQILHNGWYCVTLREDVKEGFGLPTCLIVSNLPCDVSDIPDPLPAALPQGEPWLTIPLEGTPYQPPEVTVQPYTGEYQEVLAGWLIPDSEYSILAWRGTDGDIYYGIQRSVLSSLPVTYFLRVDYDAGPERLDGGAFRNKILGEGLVLTYPVMMGTTMHAYYSFDKTGTPTLLFQTTGDVRETDWEGSMLIWEPLGAEQPGHHLLYRRDGQLYEADIPALLQKAWPELLNLDYTEWDSYCLYVCGSVELPGSGGRRATAPRQIYLDGDNLLVYPILQTFEDHIAADIEAPRDVLEAAKDFVQEVFQTPEQGYLFLNGEFYPAQVEYDDWRIESLEDSCTTTAGPWTVSTWTLTYALHTTTPDRVSMAGSRIITEDCWVSDGYPINCLFFLVDQDGGYTYLYTGMAGGNIPGIGVPGTDDFQGAIFNQLEKLGLISAQDAPYYVDHVSAYIDAPTDVLTPARSWVQEVLERLQFEKESPDSLAHPDVSYDDWRIESLDGPWYEEVDGLTIEIWHVGYQMHTSDPIQNGMLEGRFKIEDGWVALDEFEGGYLYFLVNENGSRTWLTTDSKRDGVTPGTERFRENLIQDLRYLGLLPADG